MEEVQRSSPAGPNHANKSCQRQLWCWWCYLAEAQWKYSILEPYPPGAVMLWLHGAPPTHRLSAWKDQCYTSIKDNSYLLLQCIYNQLFFMKILHMSTLMGKFIFACHLKLCHNIFTSCKWLAHLGNIFLKLFLAHASKPNKALCCC